MTVDKENPFCAECMFRSRTAVPFIGPQDAPFALVGEAPGYQEVMNGKPFVGPSGNLVNVLLKHLGIPRDDIIIGNSLLCGTISEEDKHSSDFPKALRCCRQRREYIGKELASVKSIVALGAMAAWGLSGEAVTLGGGKPRRGALHYAIESPLDGRCIPFFPTWHPAAILRSGGAASAGTLSDAEAEMIAFDIDKGYEFALGKRKLFAPKMTMTGDPDEFVAWCRRVPPGVLGIDLESTSINPLDCKITVVGLGHQTDPADPESVDAIAFWWPNDAPDGRAKQAFAELMLREDLIKTAHNLQYDFTVIERQIGKIRGPIDDTLLVHHAAFPDAKSDLGSVAHTHLIIHPWKYNFHKIDKGMKEDKKFSDEEYIKKLLEYNCYDVATTVSLRTLLRKQCRIRKVEQVADVDVRMADIARKMTERGVLIDTEVRSTLAEEFKNKLEASERKMQKLVIEGIERNIFLGINLDKTQKFLENVQKRAIGGRKNINNAHRWKVIPGWNPDSADMMALAFDVCEVELPAKALTKTGKRSVDKKALVDAAEHPLVDATIDYRRSGKMYSLYFDSDDFVLDAANRLHTAWKIHGTPTGRWSSGAGKDPGMGDIGLALQNWPKAMCRMVIAPDGWMLAGLDYSQLEYRCIALLAGEESLLEIFNDESRHRDLHSENAARLWAHAWSTCDPDTANSPYQSAEFKKRRKLLRFLTKTGLYASLYGASADTVRKQLRASSFRESDPEFARVLREITLETCQMFVDAVPRLWPKIAQWREKAVRDVQKELRIVCPLSGRRRVWPLGMVDYTQAINNRVQTLAAAIMNERFIALCDSLPDYTHPILQVHDSVVVESPEEHAKDVMQLMEDTMRTSIELGEFSCRFDVEGSVAKSWDQV